MIKDLLQTSQLCRPPIRAIGPSSVLKLPYLEGRMRGHNKQSLRAENRLCKPISLRKARNLDGIGQIRQKLPTHEVSECTECLAKYRCSNQYSAGYLVCNQATGK